MRRKEFSARWAWGCTVAASAMSLSLKDWLLVSWALSLSLVQVLEHVCPHPQTPKSMSRHPRNGTTHTWETGSATADEQSLDGFGPSLHLLEARNARRHVSDIQSVGMWSWRGSGSSLAPIAARSPLQLASGLAEAHAGPGLVGPSLPDVFQPSGRFLCPGIGGCCRTGPATIAALKKGLTVTP